MPSLSFFSPAKINLFFRVLHKRADGYHEIASLYQALSLGDDVIISSAVEDSLTCSDPHLACDETNLIRKAIAVYRKKTGVHFPVSIHLEKRIPMEAGLGGGSSNAATALWAINQLNPSPVSEDELRLWAGEFSSDAPFFFSSGTAYCTGRGEKIASLPPLRRENAFWIAKPEQGLSTPLVYGSLKPELLESRDPLSSLYASGCKEKNANIAENQILKPIWYNDLESAAFALMPGLAELKRELLALGFHTVVMTGSGTAFFCMGEVKPELRSSLSALSTNNELLNSAFSNIRFYPVTMLNRNEGHWYQYGKTK